MPLPKELCNSKKGLINLKNSDDKCLFWCLVRHKNPRRIHPERITQSDRKFAKDLDLDISFPVTIKQIPQIERQNKININVFGYDERDGIFPIRNSTEKYDDYMDLLYLEGKEGKTHYVLIKDSIRLNYQFSVKNIFASIRYIALIIVIIVIIIIIIIIIIFIRYISSYR